MLAALLLLCVQSPVPSIEPVRAEASIQRISVFKDGRAMVHRRVDLPGSGSFLLSADHAPAHGTLRVEGAPGVELRSVSSPAPGGRMREVELWFHSSPMDSVRGTLIQDPEDQRRAGLSFPRPTNHGCWIRRMACSWSTDQTFPGRCG